MKTDFQKLMWHWPYPTVIPSEVSPPSSAAPPQECETCGGTGVVRYEVPVGHEKFGKLFPCPNPECASRQQAESKRREKMLTRSGLPAMYAKLTFDTWMALPAILRQRKELAAGAAWMFSQKRSDGFSLQDAANVTGMAGSFSHESRSWLVLQGNLGVGKTGLAAAALNQMLAQGRPGLYYRLGELFADIQGRYKAEKGVSADSVLDRIKSSPVLVLDEMNVPAASDDKKRIIEELIRYRHGNGLPTLITCNVDPRRFAAMWDERTADVIFEQAHWVPVLGERLRRGISLAQEAKTS